MKQATIVVDKNLKLKLAYHVELHSLSINTVFPEMYSTHN